MDVNIAAFLQSSATSTAGRHSVRVSNTDLTTGTLPTSNTLASPDQISSSAVYHGNATAEERFHLSTQTLQLLKRYDVRQIDSKDMVTLTALMAGKHEVSEDAYISATMVTYMQGGRGTINAIDVIQKHIQSTNARIENGTSIATEADTTTCTIGMDTMNRLAAIHDALQTDDSVQMAAENTISQAWDNRALTYWIQDNVAGKAPDLPDYYFAHISSALDHLGVQRTAVAANASDKEKQAQAWKDYQTWHNQHPDTQIQIDLSPADKSHSTQSTASPATEAATTNKPAALAPSGTTKDTQDQAASDLTTRYGYSLQTLQLLKGNDIRHLSTGELSQLTSLMQSRGELTQAQIDGLQPAQQSLGTNPFSYFTHDQQFLLQGLLQGKTPTRGGLEVMNVQKVMGQDQQSQALLNKLADLHDALQSESQIQAVGVDGLQQQTDQSAFNTWVSWHSTDPSASNATPQFRTQTDVDGIFNTLQSMGVTLREAPKGANNAQKLALAWQDYQRWQATPTGNDKQAKQQVDTFV